MVLQCQNNQQLTSSEQKVVDYINENYGCIMNEGVVDIAQHAFVSVATLSRALKKCGINKITELHQKIIKSNFIYNEIANRVLQDCTDTVELIDEKLYAQIVEYILNANRIFIYANGASKWVAEELEFYLKYKKIDASYEDYISMTAYQTEVGPNDLIIVITNTDSTGELSAYVKRYKNKGVKIITCCNKTDIELTSFSDITVCSKRYDISDKQCEDLGSTLGNRLVIRAIVEYLAIAMRQ